MTRLAVGLNLLRLAVVRPCTQSRNRQNDRAGPFDIHYHVRPPDDIHPTQQGNLQAHLAYSVTAIRDPHNNSMDLLAYAERERLGRLDSPRIFTTLFTVLSQRGRR